MAANDNSVGRCSICAGHDVECHFCGAPFSRLSWRDAAIAVADLILWVAVLSLIVKVVTR